MKPIYLKCSEELAIKLGALPAKIVARNELSIPIWDVPEHCIEIDVGTKPLAWPLLLDETGTDECQ